MASARSRRFAVALVGLVGGAVFIALALRHLDLHALGTSWGKARPLPWIPLAAAAYCAGQLVRGQRLRVLVKRETALPLPTAANIVVVGYASNNVLPARLGELVRAGMLAERTGIPLSQSLTITFIERLLDGLAILGLLLAATFALPMSPPWLWSVARVASLIFGGALGVVLVTVFFPSVVLASASSIATGLGPRWRDRVLALASSITNAGAVLRRPRDAASILAYSGLTWLFESLMFALLLPVFALPLRLPLPVVAMGVTNLGILMPSSPGFVGSFHFLCSRALESQGVTPATAMSYAILVHLTFYIPVTLWGAGTILWYGIQVGTAAALARAARGAPSTRTEGGVVMHMIAPLEPARPLRPASGFDVALTEALLTTQREPLDRDAVAEVATFLSQEMQSLPARLQLMYEAGMFGFRAYVRLRYLRGFCALPVETRRAAMESWAFGPIVLLRQLFRPVRSIALLAYYEQAKVAQSLSPAPERRVTLAFESHGS